MYIKEVCVLIFPFYSARYVEVERNICCDRGKKQRDYTFIPTSLFRDCSLIRGFYFIYIYIIYIYILFPFFPLFINRLLLIY